MRMSAVEIRFDGQRYRWWQRADIRASVDDLCASVQLGVTLPGTGDNLNITANSVIDVLIDGLLIYRTRVDSLTRAVSADSHDITITGRSLGRELVDCQHSQTLSGLTLGEIARRLCAAFNVPLKITAKTVVVPDFSMQCESPANALINAARAANLLLHATPDGGIVLTRPGNAPPVCALRYGDTILDYEITDEFQQRFSEYCVKGYDYEGDSDAAYSSRARDADIKFHRPMQIMGDKHGRGLGGCERRAIAERNRRRARAHRIELTVCGWRYPAANDTLPLWDINTQVRVVIPPEKIDAIFLVGERTFRLDDRGGQITRLTLMDRAAYAENGSD
jgi:prophage tail gpP-like protein